MTQPIKAFVAEPVDLSSNPSTHCRKERASGLLSSMCVLTTHTQSK